MKWMATFLLASGLALLAGFSPAVPAARATPLAATASALPNNNPASAHDRRNHRNSNSLHHRRHHHAHH